MSSKTRRMSSKTTEEWRGFVATHGKKYVNEEDELRHFNKFLASLDFIAQHPKNASFTVGLTRFSDWLDEEVEAFFGSIFNATALKSSLPDDDEHIAMEG